MERVTLSWNLMNWITVLLMAAAGYAVLMVLSQIFVQGPPTQATGTGY
jgi:hypothetical protein